MEPTSKQIWLHQTKKNIYNVLLFNGKAKMAASDSTKDSGWYSFLPCILYDNETFGTLIL